MSSSEIMFYLTSRSKQNNQSAKIEGKSYDTLSAYSTLVTLSPSGVQTHTKRSHMLDFETAFLPN